MREGDHALGRAAVKVEGDRSGESSVERDRAGESSDPPPYAEP